MDKDELERRVAANLNKLPVKSAQDAADEAFKQKVSQNTPKVNVPPKPELNPSVSILDVIRANVELFLRQNVVKYFKGEPMDSPFTPVTFLLSNWKLLLIGLAVVVVLIVLLRWIV